MKNLFLLCIVLVSSSVFSQSLFDRLHFGVKAGGNYSDFSNANFDTEGLPGFHAGAIIAFDINGHRDSLSAKLGAGNGHSNRPFNGFGS